MVAITRIVSFILIHRVCVMNTKNKELFALSKLDLDNLLACFDLFNIDLRQENCIYYKSDMYRLYEFCLNFIDYYNNNYSKFV